MSAFDYVRPASVGEALRHLQMPGAFALAGGQSLLYATRARRVKPTLLVDIGRLAEMAGVTVEAGVMRIGALTTHSQLAASPLVRTLVPGLALAAGHVADPAVRHRGTVGGSLAENHLQADYTAIFLALAATVSTTRRTMALSHFLQPSGETALDQGELILAVTFALPLAFAYAKFPHPASKYALVGVAISRNDSGPSVAVTGAGRFGAFSWPEAAAALGPEINPAAIEALRFERHDLLGHDHSASAPYRAQLMTVMAGRAAQALWTQH